MRSRDSLQTFTDRMRAAQGRAAATLRGLLPACLLLGAAFGGHAVAQDYPATLRNTATLTLNGVVDPNPGDNIAEDVNDLQVEANVSVEKIFLDGSGPFLPGQQVSYSIVVSNAGPSMARDIDIVDTPTNLTLGVVSGACTALPCTIASLAPGASATITMAATIDAAGSFSNHVAVALPPGDVDPDPSDNEDDGGGGEAEVPMASISVSPDRVDEDANTPLVYTVSFSVAPLVDTVVGLDFSGTANPGADYTGQVANVTLPAGETSVSFDVLPVADTEVEPDETVVVTIVAGTGYDGAGASATGTIANDDDAADVSVSKTFTSTGPFVVGQLVTYTIDVSNAGPSDAANVVVTDTPTNLEIVSVSGAGCTEFPCTIPTLVNGATVQINLEARILAAGSFGNSATADSEDVADPDPSDNEDDGGGGDAVLPGASITVAPVSVDEDSGDTLVFTITLDVAPALDTTLGVAWGGTATEGVDYTGAQATVTIPAGQTTATITISPTPDTVYEGDETVIATLQPGSGYDIDEGTAQATIVDDDLPAADLSITKDDGSATYVPGGTATYVLVVSNAGPDAAPGVVVTDNLPAGVTLAGPWTCTASAGSSCSAASGGGIGGNAVNVTVDLETTGTVTISVPVQFSADPEDY